MYTPLAFKNTEIAQLLQFIKRYGFAVVVSQGASLQVSHLPLQLQSSPGKYGTLIGHMAKANPHWKDLANAKEVLCIFNGPHSYISPAWYKKLPAAPTWNYAAVHARGTAEIIHDHDEITTILKDLITAYDPNLQNETSPAKIPDSYIKTMVEHIVGFRIEISELIGKFKLSQNRSLEDQHGMLESLAKQNNDDAKQLADFIKKYNP